MNKNRKVDVNLSKDIVLKSDDSDTVPEGSPCGDECLSNGSCDEWYSDNLCVCGLSIEHTTTEL